MSDAGTPQPDQTGEAVVEAATAIVQAETAKVDPNVDPDNPAGVPHGTIVQAPASGFWEKIVHDFDEAGNVIGWHKEHLDGPPEGQG
jgi:hypothetical protein